MLVSRERAWSQFELKFNLFVCSKFHGLSGQAPLLQAYCSPIQQKRVPCYRNGRWLLRLLGTKVVNYMSERDEATDSWLPEDLKRKGVGFYKVCSSSVCEGGFSYY